MKITENCIINGMPEALYHSDPTPVLEGFAHSASFSSSMARVIIEQTEHEAMLSSQRLNPNWKESEDTDATSIGTIAHDYILRGGQRTYEVAPFADWRTNDAKIVRKDIESRGLIALNQTTEERLIGNVKKMHSALKEQLSEHQDFPGLMLRGKGEQSAFAFDGEIWNRARFDWLDEIFPDVIVDYKTTGIAFNNWEKNQLWGEGTWMQNLHYRKVYDIITGRKSKFIFVVQQTTEPFHVRIFDLDASYTDEMAERYFIARKRFKNCLKTGVWRGQPPYTKHSCPPPWILNQWENDSLDEKGAAMAEQTKPEILMAG